MQILFLKYLFGTYAKIKGFYKLIVVALKSGN